MNKALFSTLSLAILLTLTPRTTYAEEGFYVGASIGSASLSDDIGGFDVDADSTAFRLTAGWQFNDYLSVEAGYHQFGTFDQTFTIDGQTFDISLKADGFTLGVTGALPVSNRFALYGRAGAFFWDGDAEINDVLQTRPEDTNLYIGAGASFELANQFTLIADWTRYKLEDTESDVVSLGLTYGF